MTDEVDAAALEAGRVFCAGPVDFVLGAASLSQLPPGDRPEIAFAGRSNVGKSSLVNAVFNRKALARTSAAPGRTRELNYFNLLQDRMYLVDLPGYGYARVSRTQAEAWMQLTRRYLRGRQSLRRVFLLIDSRRGQMDADTDVMEMLDTAAVVYQVVLTKADKLKTGQKTAVVAKTAELLAKRPAAHPTVLLTSSETGEGLPDLRAEIAALA